MPSIMFGKQVITLPKRIIKKLQTIENGVFRYLIGVAGYGPVAALRGEVGASRVETRVMETILMFALDTPKGNFEKVKDYMIHDKETGKGSWIRTANSYRIEIGVTWEEMLEMDRRNLKMKIREWDNQKWIEEVGSKPTLKWYKEGKHNIQYDMCYNNSISSNYLAKARTNTLHLEEYHARRNRNHNKTCRLCGLEDEDLEHFLVVCPALENKRDREIMESWQNINN